MILGTWNLQDYPPRYSARGISLTEEFLNHHADVWFITELHADWQAEERNIHFSQPRVSSRPTHRLSAISSSWSMEPVLARDDPADSWVCLARLTDATTNRSVLAACSVLPWRSLAPEERYFHGRELTYAEAFHHVLDYTVRRITEERRPDEDVMWGGDFNQSLSGRDYVGTVRGRAELREAAEHLGLRALTSDAPAMNPIHPAIDHLFVPTSWVVQGNLAVHCPKRDGTPLSDHALYIVEAAPRQR